MSYVLFPLFVALVVLSPIAVPFAWAGDQGGAEDSSSVPPLTAIAGPVFITTIYPVVELDKDLIESMPVIEDAYNFWGKELASSRIRQTYFPSPLSYPYKFSDSGMKLLHGRLRQLALVDPESIELKTLPTIPKKWHYQYQPRDLRAFLIEEPYLSFTIKGWEKVTFMKFPTFVVVLFDHTNPPVRSYGDYKALARYWRDKIGALQQHEELSEVIGISRKTRKWASIPILTFVSLLAYMDESFQNRYIFGSDPWPQKSQRFLREVSLRDISRESRGDNTSTSLWGCQDILHERDPITVWRFYYSVEPMFYDGPNWPFADVNPTGPVAMLNRILRVALFANVTLPDTLEKARILEKKLKKRDDEVRAMREKLFESFSSRRINFLHSALSTEMRYLPTINAEIDKIERLLIAVDQLYAYLRRPLDPPLDADIGMQTDQTKSDDKNPCLEQFHFERQWNVLNDGRKVNTFTNEINIYLKSIKKNTESVTEQVRDGIELLEARRNMVEGQKTEAFAILFPAMGASVLTLLSAFLKLMQRHIPYRRHNRHPMMLQGEFYRDHYGRWHIKYGGGALQSWAKLGRMKSWWQEFTEQFMDELKRPVIPILGALLGAGFWVVWLYLP